MSKVLTTEALIDPTADVRECALGRYTEVGPRTSLLAVRLDDYSYVSNDSDIAYARIGKFCSIAAHVRINPGNHPMWRASQSHFTYRASRYWPGEMDEGDFFDWRRSHGVTIGHDVWIGHGVVILPGRTIGTGAVLGAGAIVTKDVAPYAIAVGNPARPVRERFAPQIVRRLMLLAWWDWEHEALRRALQDFRSLPIEAFLDKHEASRARPSRAGPDDELDGVGRKRGFNNLYRRAVSIDVDRDRDEDGAPGRDL